MASPNDIRAGGAYVEVRADNKKLKGDLKESESILKTLKKQFGEESDFGMTLKTLRGAGAIAGIGLVAKAIGDSTQRMRELNDEFKKGTITSGQLAEEVAKSIPVFGEVYRAGRNIREMLTGEEFDANTAAQRTLKEAAAIDRKTKALADTTKQVRDLNRETQASKLTGIEKTLFELRNKYGDMLDAVNMNKDLSEKSKAPLRKAITENRNAAIGDAYKKISDQYESPLSKFLTQTIELDKLRGLGVLDKSKYKTALSGAGADLADSGFFSSIIDKAQSFINQRIVGSAAGAEATKIFAGIQRFMDNLTEMKNSKALSLDGVSFGGFGSDVLGAGKTQVVSYLESIAKSSASIDQKTSTASFK